jgi:trans-aconitate 2-methyltransferase
MPSWNPGLYLKFADQRTRPARDLAIRARACLASWNDGASAIRAVDLGCGPGNSTAVVADLFPDAAIVGLDSSPEMIASARKTTTRAEWVVADVATWSPDRKFDLVFSNAMLQWVGDQKTLLAAMASWLAPGGVIAVQVPGNGGSPLHRALLAAAGSWANRERFEGLDEAIRYREPEFYHDALSELGLASDVWETTYWHRMENRESLIEWYSGTGMRPWLDRLDDDAERDAFKRDVLNRARDEYSVRADGSVLFPFRRIFFTASR